MIQGKRILITGASGLLGSSLCARLAEGNRIYGLRNHHAVNVPGVDEIQIDLTDKDAIAKVFSETKPEFVIHAAGLTNVDQCETDPQLAELLNVEVTRSICTHSTAIGAKLIHISTDHLFDGSVPFATETLPVCPMNQYGLTKAKAEIAVSELKSALILRTNFFGPGRPWRTSFSDWILNQLRADQTVNAFHDVFFSPISISYFADLMFALVEREAAGVFNVVCRERVSKYEFAVKLAIHFGYSQGCIRSVAMGSVQLKARRPADMSLSSEKLRRFIGFEAPDLETCLRRLKLEGETT